VPAIRNRASSVIFLGSRVSQGMGAQDRTADPRSNQKRIHFPELDSYQAGGIEHWASTGGHGGEEEMSSLMRKKIFNTSGNNIGGWVKTKGG